VPFRIRVNFRVYGDEILHFAEEVIQSGGYIINPWEMVRRNLPEDKMRVSSLHSLEFVAASQDDAMILYGVLKGKPLTYKQEDGWPVKPSVS
jgi:hypothetical protein